MVKQFLNQYIGKVDSDPPKFWLDWKHDLRHNQKRAYRLLDEALFLIADSPEIHERFFALNWATKCKAVELTAAGILAEVLSVDT